MQVYGCLWGALSFNMRRIKQDNKFNKVLTYQSYINSFIILSLLLLILNLYIMSNLTLSQMTFFRHLNTNDFKYRVLQRQNKMGMDGAFYFTIGEMQSETKNYSFDDLNDAQQEDFISDLITEIPELEF